ncbi:MAG: sigma-54 dependent transcriptional regulator [Bacteroidetes bacterium]|nr:sigma-54 dependent transcriptional regulator [Bacteroidota bacterium]MBU1678459.1 sigma-54 dependent transcriptional regulator [Bacteroidota bacterium]MBU2505234.1 sigma-54 dependent transcriptional regulator [Bacteroidota bacterium]
MNKAQILIADDDKNLCYLLKEELVIQGFSVEITFDGNYAIEKLKNKNFDLLLLDLQMKEIGGYEVLQFVQENQPATQVIVLTASNEVRTAIDCMKNGAYDYIVKPYEFGQLLVVIERALEHKELVLRNKILTSRVNKNTPNTIIGESKAMRDIINYTERAALTDSSILLEGETGTGKELFAEFIHKNSIRNRKPMVAINCASLPDQLIESELFGYEKGAFTDAKTSKQGLVEMANGGTLFLDEIGELSLTLQPKLLRFLEKGEYRRVGGVSNLKSDVRIIGATNKNLLEEAERKNFRRDLLFRLNVVTLQIPPLRERGDDILLLASYFLQKNAPIRVQKKLTPVAEKALLEYSFPGNVRELSHIIERALIFSDGEIIKHEDLNLPKKNSFENDFSFDKDGRIQTMEEIERMHIQKTLDANRWNREQSARALGISQKTLYTKIKNYGLVQEQLF